MLNTMNLLIIEDHADQIQMYQDNIDAYNFTKKLNINAKYVKNLDDGLKALNNPDYDAAIVDLKLSQGDKDGNGNQIIAKIRSSLRIPIIVISGYPQDLDAQYKAENNPFIKVHKKDDSFIDILNDLVAVHKTGITNILGKKGQIEQYLNNIFWNNISATIDYWKIQAIDETNTEKILLRYTLSHLQEHLELSDTQEDFEEYLPIEMYVSPPIKKNAFTGDIIKSTDDNSYWIILNPSCDMAQSKAKSVTVAQIEKIQNDYVINLKRQIKDGNAGEKAIIKEKEIELKKLLKNSGSLKYHFLPQASCFEGGFINFQKIQSIKFKEINTKYERIASITDRFSKDIIARFSHYYSRQGQPDFNTSKIIEEILEGVRQEEKV